MLRMVRPIVRQVRAMTRTARTLRTPTLELLAMVTVPVPTKRARIRRVKRRKRTQMLRTMVAVLTLGTWSLRAMKSSGRMLCQRHTLAGSHSRTTQGQDLCIACVVFDSAVSQFAIAVVCSIVMFQLLCCLVIMVIILQQCSHVCCIMSQCNWRSCFK